MHPETLVIDFDSTFIVGESLEELAALSLRGHTDGESRLAEMRRLTDAGMSGEIPFADALAQRLPLLNANREHVEKLQKELAQTVTPSIARNRAFFLREHKRIYIVSSGFRELIEPIAVHYGIDPTHVLANAFRYDFHGNIVGCDLNNPLSSNQGKVKAVKALSLKGPVVVIGDGVTDAEIRDMGAARSFYAFEENVQRPEVSATADEILPDFDAYLSMHQILADEDHAYGKALFLENIHPIARPALVELGIEICCVAESPSAKELGSLLQGVTILGIRSKTQITSELLDQAPDLLAIGVFCIGTNQIDLDACTERGIAVFNAPYSNTRSVVELAIGEIIMLMRGTFQRSSRLHKGHWDKNATGSKEIRGKTLGIVGYGNIGSQLSVIAEALGMRVLYYDIEEKLPLGNAEPCVSLDDVLKRSDIVTIHVDGRASNAELIGADQIAMMRNEAYFLNLSRGHVVDLDALREALDSGKLRGAAIDVYPTEPSSPEEKHTTPLQGADTALITPHIGGSTEEAQYKIGKFVAQHLAAYISRGSSSGSVNLPQLMVPVLSYGLRLIHIHRNLPGKMAAISKIMADQGMNIETQLLQTNDLVGYVAMDINASDAKGVVDALLAMPDAIKVRPVTP
jgi:D-3-phosphoglycerate dehydrogenase